MLKLKEVKVLDTGVLEVKYLETETGEFWRATLTPLDKDRIPGFCPEVQRIARAVWTEDVKNNWSKALE